MSEAAVITSNTLQFVLTILGNPFETFEFITVQGLGSIVVSAPNYDNVSGLWDASYTLLESDLFSQVCLSVEQITNFGKVFVNESCATANTASLSTGYFSATDGSIASLILVNSDSPDVLLAVNSFDPVQNFRLFGGAGVVMFLWIVSAMGLAMAGNPITLIIGTAAGIITSIALGLFGLSWLGVMPLLITGGILIYKMSE